jgi:hypothetical protein
MFDNQRVKYYKTVLNITDKNRIILEKKNININSLLKIFEWY